LTLKISGKQKKLNTDFFQPVNPVYFCTFFLVLTANAIILEAKTTIAAANERSAKLLNSGTVGVGEAETVEVAEIVEVGLEVESDITETVLSAAFVTNTSFLPES